MNDPLWMCNPPTSPDTPSAISSQASEGGVTPSDLPDGPQIDLFGRVVAPVSPLVVRENLGGGAIHAIFGQRGIASSASAALQSSLVNRLKQRLDTAGLTLFAMTWSEKTTPSGRSVCLLRALGHRISGSDCGSWPSLKANNSTGAGTRGEGGENLQTAVRKTRLLVSGPPATGSPALTAKRGQLNPAHSRWLMGYLIEWDDCAATATPSSRKPQPPSSAPTSTSKP